MTKAVLTACARLLAERLAEFGLERDGHVFRRYSPAGDVVIVDLQSHKAFFGETRFYVNIGFLLAPYWQWQVHDRDLPATRRPNTSHTTYFGRVRPPDDGDGTDQWVVDAGAQPGPVVDRIAAGLRERLPVLLRWFDRDYLWRAAIGDFEELGYATEPAKMWLLAERGTSAELHRILFESGPDDEPLEIDRYIWEYARRRDGQPGGLSTPTGS
ncbi:DUF4304 domain-containing protein [Actinoplanes solisilvae]|uniref:DUF4304 domain-containing protein n=1 Tax=Actinoplanes solisilvae TaxID=2486853 RepID=UPI000FD9AB30|nr:DUF4304 domain-containing protein [Actinoplanes solisilvae]